VRAGVAELPLAAFPLWASAGISTAPCKQRDNRIILAEDLCINSLTVCSWDPAKKYLRRGTCSEKSALGKTNLEAFGGANQGAGRGDVRIHEYVKLRRTNDGIDRN
jgi:hypothetical protein